jgi:hypothetical protein
METPLAGSGSPSAYMISLTEYMERFPGERGAAPPHMKNPALHMKTAPADGSHPGEALRGGKSIWKSGEIIYAAGCQLARGAEFICSAEDFI